LQSRAQRSTCGQQTCLRSSIASAPASVRAKPLISLPAIRRKESPSA
jgi:hypothetical protein